MAKDQIDLAEKGVLEQQRAEETNSTTTAVSSSAPSKEGVTIPSPVLARVAADPPITNSEGQDVGGMSSPHTHGGLVQLFFRCKIC